MADGFYTALGTPLDHEGNLATESFIRHTEDQIRAGAAGLLAMGSMGMQPMLTAAEFVKTARAASETAKGEVPVFVGVMDNSIARISERIESLAGMRLDGVVATAPYYYQVTQEHIKAFFTALAGASPYPVYLYDLPSVTQVKMQPATVLQLMKVQNIAGIKTGDLVTARILSGRKQEVNPDFEILYSGLDLFDTAYLYGIRGNLDGMFSCTPAIATKLYQALENGEKERASGLLNDILLLRDTMAECGIFPAFTHAMNVLGYEGNFSPDYERKSLESSQKEKVEACMKRIGLI